MNKKELVTELEPVLSPREIDVVLKRLNNKHLTQTESNYLSRSIRPKLKSAEYAVSNGLISLLEYRRKKYEREDNILRKKIVSALHDIISSVKAVILFGSYVRNNHTNYRDIDVMIILNKKLWKISAERYRLKRKIEKNSDIKIDVNLLSYDELKSALPYSPLLQTQLEDCKIIYGDVELTGKRIISRAYLHRKLLETDYVIELGKNIKPRYIYNAIRNCLSIELFLKRLVKNKLIITAIEDNIGRTTAISLLENNATETQIDIALGYLRYLYDNLMEVLANEQKRPA